MARQLNVIATDIYRNWKAPNYAAKPYLEAMAGLGSIDDTYGAESARSVVQYFLANTSAWRGEEARRIKAELRAMVRK
jgi:hypothetical protein